MPEANHHQTNAHAHTFIERWQGVSASELSTAQSFVRELCELLGVPVPHATPEQNYMFERPITFSHGDGSTSPGRIDCYLRGHFVLESKKLKSGPQTKGFDDALLRARAQAEGYARALPPGEGRPPFLVVVDVGNVIELYAEFTRSGATYTPFPDPRSHRIALASLLDAAVRDRLKSIWTDPESLNPARASARVTREVAGQLAELARSLEQSGHRADHVAAFLTRCLFSMFAEDVELLPKGSFLSMLQSHREQPVTLQQMLRVLWIDMDSGGFSAALATQVLRFNGKLFKQSGSSGYSLLLNQEQIERLIAAARSNWREVEPAIFGTLLERALDPSERHALGAHYTPRAYVERLVLPTVVEPLRADWANAQAAALVLAREAAELEANPVVMKTNTASNIRAVDKYEAAVRSKWREARQVIKDFHHSLCNVRVLDPACGSGNFLYVTLEHLKRLEGEVLNQLADLGESQDLLSLGGETVTPKQLLGIELNERAAGLAELVLWIGYLQWHIRTSGNKAVAEPVVHDYGNIEHRDAVLAWDDTDLAYDDGPNGSGQLLSRWDGKTFKMHPVTGAQVPDEAAIVPQWKYSRPAQAKWPKTDFIVGNPPFIGNKRMRETLGDGYTDALRKAWPEVTESADFVMYWWHHAVNLISNGKTRRAGLITTNSLTMIFNRRVVQTALDRGVSIAFAIPDHPWVDSSNGAAVRIAMTVSGLGSADGRLLNVAEEQSGEYGEMLVRLDERVGTIHADLSIGANLAKVTELRSNANLGFRGVTLSGSGFWVDPDDSLVALEPEALRPLLNGRDLTDRPRGVFVIDFFGLKVDEARAKFPTAYQRVFLSVKPERDQSQRSTYREKWWLFAEARPELRQSTAALSKFLATPMTAKHRTFQFVDTTILPDQGLIAIATEDAFHLGVLSSRTHADWSLATGGTLEDRPRYNNSRCFETFPFPDQDTGLTPELRQHIAQLAEQIDAHRKRQQVAHPGLTLTGMYNVLESLREGRPLTAKEKTIHQQGLVSVLKELHDELDAAVLQAYGLTSGLSSDALLTHLVALNAQRAAEEKTGKIRWLRPEFQNPAARSPLSNQELLAPVVAGLQANLIPNLPAQASLDASATLQSWPNTLPEQVRALAQILASSTSPLALLEIEARFKGKGPWKKGLPRILETLEALGRARREGDGWRG